MKSETAPEFWRAGESIQSGHGQLRSKVKRTLKPGDIVYAPHHNDLHKDVRGKFGLVSPGGADFPFIGITRIVFGGKSYGFSEETIELVFHLDDEQ